MEQWKALTPEECREALEMVRRRRWEELADIEAAVKLAPLAVRYLGPADGWESASPSLRGQCIGRLCEETVLEDLKAPEGETTPASYSYSILKTVYVERQPHRRVMERLGLPLKGQKYYKELLPQALERLCQTWREKLRTLPAAEGAAGPFLSDNTSFAAGQERKSSGVEAWPSATQQFQTLIEDKTSDFVGREYVFEAIRAFLAGQPSGYFVIEGDPGVGKSAILAEYVRRTDAVAHFNVQSQGINRADQFLEGICGQLIHRYGRPYSSLPPEATRDGSFLASLLDQISRQLAPEEKLVIAVDALDEVDPAGQGSGANLLYLPSSLAEGVYIVATRRPVTLPLLTYSPYYVFDLMQHPEESRQDVRTYLRQAAERLALISWRDAQGLGTEDFVAVLAERSENNFMYLRYVLGDIQRGIYRDLSIETLPEGLEGYYQDHWRRMGMTARPLPRSRIKVVYIMAEAREPISRRLVARFAGEDELTVQEVLDQWGQFLHRQPGEPGQTLYSVYHASFRDFLHRKDVVQAAGVSIGEINARIADNLWEELFPDE